MALASGPGDLAFETVLNMIGGMVSHDVPDLSARQLGIFLVCYRESGDHTVRSLAARFNISKPAVTRALDRLAEFDLTRRVIDPNDRRSVFIVRTTGGAAFLRQLRNWAATADAGGSKPVSVNSLKAEVEPPVEVKESGRKRKEIAVIPMPAKASRVRRPAGDAAVKSARRPAWN